ncbi:hypothetical protein CUMW_123320 [Citrus unshiu]|uniref:Uncharacterized protein n=1 Tax=Citrus unshiu TaxID=55188 RepID=A0A2H5PCA2_CITUN|nr:hypothetical protein CUMW_123320 [Citrus unshiu]
MRIETERAKNLMCLLRDPEGNSLEAAMYFPLHARPQQLSQTVNELLNNFLWRMELSRAYQPQAAFRIRPPNRCSATIAGDWPRGSGDTTVRLWDLNSQTPMFSVLRGTPPRGSCSSYKSWALRAAWSPGGNLLVSGSKA